MNIKRQSSVGGIVEGRRREWGPSSITPLRAPSPPCDGGGQWSLPSPTLFPFSWSMIHYSSSYSSSSSSSSSSYSSYSSSSSSPSTSEGHNIRRTGFVEGRRARGVRKRERERQKSQERERGTERARKRERERERERERKSKRRN